jgi:hypothetical protein
VTKASFGIALTAKCAGCGRDVEDWAERTKGTGEPQATVDGPRGKGYLVECRTPCPHCSNPRIRLSYRIG